MRQVLVAAIVLVGPVRAFNPVPAVPVVRAPKVQSQSAPNGVVAPRTMPGRRPAFLPPSPQGTSGSSFLPPMPAYDPALSATQQGQETLPTGEQADPNTERVEGMQADSSSLFSHGGSWFGGFAVGMLASSSAMFLALRARIFQQSSAAPQRDQVELPQNSFLSESAGEVYSASPALQGALAGPLVANFTNFSNPAQTRATQSGLTSLDMASVSVQGGPQKIPCDRGEVLRTAMQIGQAEVYYTMKGKLWNCNGNGQCGTCKVDLVSGRVTPRTAAEDKLLNGCPPTYRLACQTAVEGDVVVRNKPDA